jgi:hypothetical protein
MKPSYRMPALLAVAAALWFARGLIVHEPVEQATAARPAAPRTAARSLPAALGEVCTTPAALPVREALAVRLANDPFVLVAPPAPKPVRVAVAVERPFVGPPLPPPPPPPAKAPPLPYRFMGALNEKGQPASVFLGFGDTLIFAKVGDTLEGGFRLEGIKPRELTFLHIQTNLTVRLPVDGEPS